MFRNIATVSRTNTLWEILGQMVNQQPGFAVVLDYMTLVGVITEYDLLRWLVQGRDFHTSLVGDVPLSEPHVVREDTPCQDLLRVYHQRRFRRFPVINEDGMLCGGIMEKQMLVSFPRSILLAHYRVSDIVTTQLPVVPPETDYQTVAKLMVEWHRGCVLVTRGQNLLGIISEGEMLRFRVRPSSNGVVWSSDAPAESFMCTDPITIEPDADLLHAMDQFQVTGRRRLPVVNQEGKLVGLLTQTDLLKQAVHAVRSHRAVLNPEDIIEPALWFSPEGKGIEGHAILAMNEKGAKALALDMAAWTGRSVSGLSADLAIWDAIVVLLRHCNSLGPIHLQLKTGDGALVCVSSRFQWINTPNGEDRVFWTMGEIVRKGRSCR